MVMVAATAAAVATVWVRVRVAVRVMDGTPVVKHRSVPFLVWKIKFWNKFC